VSIDEARVAASIFDPQRLRLARQLRRETRAGLARQIEVSPAAVSQWEAGEARPKAQTLLRLSDALGFPVGFFATSGREIPNLDIECSFFRSLRKSRQADRDAAMAHAALIAELVDVVERHARLPVLDIPSLPIDIDADLDDVDATAARVRDAWELDDEPIADVVRELERHGAVAARLALAEEGVDAFSWPAPHRPIVILGSDKRKRDRSRFDAAHELGHLVMHRDYPEPANRDLEKQAHRFAGAFLLPADQLAAEWPQGRLRWTELIQLKHRWQMSLGALLYRARDLELISATTYESAVKYMSRAGWRKTEPGDLGPPERPRLLRRAVEALDAEGISLEDLADEARLPLEVVSEYLTVLGVPPRVTIDL
jgi:Zn-dependent peptidase ImmA (M78 family)/transcriptional regulator with XRE-family HTH domain